MIESFPWIQSFAIGWGIERFQEMFLWLSIEVFALILSRHAKTLTFRKHIFHFAHEFWDFPSWEAHVGRSKIFAVEANPLVNVVYQRPYRHCNLCCKPVKCIWVYLVHVQNVFC